MLRIFKKIVRIIKKIFRTPIKIIKITFSKLNIIGKIRVLFYKIYKNENRRNILTLTWQERLILGRKVRKYGLYFLIFLYISFVLFEGIRDGGTIFYSYHDYRADYQQEKIYIEYLKSIGAYE